MNQDDFARRIIGRLDPHLAKLPEGIVKQLADARVSALQGRPMPTPLHLRLAGWVASHRLLGAALPALFALVVVGAVFFLQSEPAHDPFDVEAALLADELPIHAYTDPGFDAWLRHTSYEQQQ
jgi:hypothetical protein